MSAGEMRLNPLRRVLALFALWALACAALAQDLPAYSTQFDTARDARADLRQALAAAGERNRHVLVMVGGDWCVWCFLLDRHFRDDAEAARIFHEGFELLRVYYGEDNTNKEFLSGFPDFELFPHFFIVARDGRVLASIEADIFIRDAKYDTALIADFVRRWQP
jgi:thiol:disulfide interchange protein